jgi:hypothetical protein
MECKVDEKAGTITLVRCPLRRPSRRQRAGRSSSCGTGGSFKTGKTVGGKPLTITCSGYTPKG